MWRLGTAMSGDKKRWQLCSALYHQLQHSYVVDDDYYDDDDDDDIDYDDDDGDIDMR